MTLELEKIIAQAYKIFGGYRIKTSLDVCPCCVTDEEKKLLTSTPLHQLSVELLSIYNDSAKSAFQNAGELKYFLPRMLELIAQFQFPSHSCEICLQRIRMVKKEEWKENELILIHTFIEVFFIDSLSLYPLPNFFCTIDGIVVMFYKADIDLNKLFSIWMKNSAYQSVLHYCYLILNKVEEKRGEKYLVNTFLDDFSGSIFTKWLLDTKTKNHFKNRIETIIMNNKIKDNTALEMLNCTYEII